MGKRLLWTWLVVISTVATGQAPRATFNGIEEWKHSLARADLGAMKALYSTAPPAKFVGPDKKPTPDITPEFDFWQNIISSNASEFEVNTVGVRDQQALHMVSLEIALKVHTPNGLRTRYVLEQQAWQQQSDRWRIVAATHSDLLKMRPALKPNAHLYDGSADAKEEIKKALAKASSSHQRVIVVFGANWCYDCHVLDQAFHQADVAPILEKNFQIVHVDVGDDGKRNNDLAAKYEIPLQKGIPALAILGPDGNLLYSQRKGEWESARSLDPDDVIAFLNKWKPN